jgi:excisionase family DNA binding protein
MMSRTEDAKARREAAVDNGTARGLNVVDVEALWPVGRSTIYLAIKSGALRSYKRGRNRILYPADVDAWIKGDTAAA